MAGTPFLPDISPGVSLIQETVTVASGATPIGGNVHVPTLGQGVWLGTVQFLLNNSPQTQAVATFVLNGFVGAKNVLASTVLSATWSVPNDLGITTISVGNPTTGGTIPIAVAWTAGGSYPGTINLTLRRIADIS